MEDALDSTVDVVQRSSDTIVKFRQDYRVREILAQFAAFAGAREIKTDPVKPFSLEQRSSTRFRSS